MNTRPRIKVSLTQFDKILENSGFALLILMWVLTIINYLKSPQIVPIHYDLSGNADGFGNKIALFILPIIPTILFFGLTQLNKYPHVFNYMTEITEANALSQYTRSTRLIRILKVSIVLGFTVDILFTFLATIGVSKGLGVWFLPLELLLFGAPVIFIIVQSLRQNRKVA